MVTDLDRVIELVKKGNTISGSLRALGIDRTKFYKSISQQQKLEIRFHKTTTLIHGTSGHNTSRHHCFELDTEEEL